MPNVLAHACGSQLHKLRTSAAGLLLKLTGKNIFTTAPEWAVLLGAINKNSNHRQMWANRFDRTNLLRVGTDVVSGLRNVLPGSFRTLTYQNYPPHAVIVGSGRTARVHEVKVLLMDFMLAKDRARQSEIYAQYNNNINNLGEPTKTKTLTSMKEIDTTLRWQKKPLECLHFPRAHAKSVQSARFAVRRLDQGVLYRYSERKCSFHLRLCH